MASKIKWIVLAALLVAGGALFYKKVFIPKSTYAHVVAQKGNLVLRVFGIGTVSAKNFYPVSSHFGGKLLEVLKDQGESVKKGEVIARIDPVDLPQQLAQAKALVTKAQNALKAAKEEAAALKPQIEMATLTFERYARLYKKGYAAKAEYDKARTDLSALRAKLSAARAQTASANDEVARAKKAVEALEVRMACLTVRAPFDGYVVSKEAEASQTIAPQQPILTLVKPSEVWVRANVDERISGDVKVGQSADIVLRSRPNAPIAGRVARIEAKSDPVTEERIVDVAFKQLPKPFYINEQAEAYIHTGAIHDAVLVPSRVIVHGGVWVYQNGEARFVNVKVLGRDDQKSAVQGVEAGAIILVPDSKKRPLFDGADVRL